MFVESRIVVSYVCKTEGGGQSFIGLTKRYTSSPFRKLYSLQKMLRQPEYLKRNTRVHATEHNERFEPKNDPLLCISWVSATPST